MHVGWGVQVHVGWGVQVHVGVGRNVPYLLFPQSPPFLFRTPLLHQLHEQAVYPLLSEVTLVRRLWFFFFGVRLHYLTKKAEQYSYSVALFTAAPSEMLLLQAVRNKNRKITEV